MRYDPLTRAILEAGGLFRFAEAHASGRVRVPTPATGPRPMTMAEKILASHRVDAASGEKRYVKPGDACLVRVDAGYSHEFTTAQVHHFLAQEYGAGYRVPNPAKFAVFEDHLLYATGVSRMARFSKEIETLRELQREFQRLHRGARLPARKGSRRASATRSPARPSSTPAGISCRQPTRTPAWAAATTRSRGASERPSTRHSCTRLHLRGGPQSIPLRARGRAPR